MEVEDKEPVSPTRQEEVVRFELEMENSDLRKTLSQQVEKYNHDMELITQVCGRSHMSFTGIFVYSCANSLHLCVAYISPYPLLFHSCCVYCLIICVCLSLVCPFYVKPLVNVEGKVRIESAQEE